MSAPSSNSSVPNLFLTDNEQSLLRAALKSNTTSGQSNPSPSSKRPAIEGSVSQQAPNTPDYRRSLGTMGSYSGDMYKSPIEDTPASGHFDGLDNDTSPLLDFDLEDGSFDWDTSGMIGDLPGTFNGDDTEHHDKRKKSTDEDEDDEGTGKRREGDEKATARKPGRKPLTGEPTTKRKAQNRAAQRAFRERKERHLKDLELKVEDLEKASESTNHENGRLRAHVERLNTEVREYRKRLSMSAPGIGRSPPTASSMPYNNYTATNNDFQFAFPKFGDLPGSIFGSNGSLAKTKPPPQSNPSFDRGSSSSVPSLARASSSQSPTTKSPVSINGNYGTVSSGPNLYHSPSSQLNGGGMDELNGLFSPSILKSASRNTANEYGFSTAPSAPAEPRKASSTDSYTALANVPNFNSTSTGSPSASSVSHVGQGSSCGTTPEPSAESPKHRQQSEGALNTISEETAASTSTQGKKSFCSDWAKACGNIANPVPQTMLESNASSAPPSSLMKSSDNIVNTPNNNSIDWLAQQNGGQFDPVLFGDYRDPQENIMNNGFGDFFNDAFLTQDFGSPFNAGDLLSEPQQEPYTAPAPPTVTLPPKQDLMKEVDAAQNANDDPEVVPAKQDSFIACDKLWDRVQASDKVMSGEFDMDDLCKQLKAKAKCSGKGAMIEQSDVDKILGPALGQKDFLKGFI